jgi:hypothetical protein
VSEVVVVGALRDHPVAWQLAHEVQRVHHRYAAEVVGAYQLCPFMRDPATAFGRFTVVLDRELDLERAVAEVIAAGVNVVHLVYPLIDADVTSFERFGNKLHVEVTKRIPRAPVHATFHPHMEGDGASAARLVGMLRRAPDPFVQFVPEGLHDGGTTYLDPASFDPTRYAHPNPTSAQSTYQRLTAADLDTVSARIASIAADRDRSYASYLDALR